MSGRDRWFGLIFISVIGVAAGVVAVVSAVAGMWPEMLINSASAAAMIICFVLTLKAE